MFPPMFGDETGYQYQHVKYNLIEQHLMTRITSYIYVYIDVPSEWMDRLFQF
jgi:uncharacterized membrane protein YjdF